MTTATLAPDRSADHYGLGDVVRSEWTKFISLRSTRWTLAAFAVTGVALGTLISALTGHAWAHLSAHSRANWDPTNNTLAGLIPGYLLIPMLGVLMMSSEYSSNAIRSTLAAVPRRQLVLAAKVLVFAAPAPSAPPSAPGRARCSPSWRRGDPMPRSPTCSSSAGVRWRNTWRTSSSSWA